VGIIKQFVDFNVTNQFLLFCLLLDGNVLNYPVGWYISEYSTNTHMSAHNIPKCNYSTTSSSKQNENFNPFAFDDTIESDFWSDAKRYYEFRYNQVSN
jgi:hypothetical protein